MAIGVVSFNGQRLFQARKGRELKSVSLAELVGVSPTTISLYEKGEQKPKQETLEKISSVLNLPVGYFLSEIPVDKPHTLFWRSISSATKSARARVQARHEWFIEAISYLEAYFDFPKLNIPELDIPEDFRDITNNSIEAITSQLRQHWRLNDSPVANITRTLESNGLVVYRTLMTSEKLDAFSDTHSKSHPLIALSSHKNNYYRSRADAAHELGHVILHKNVSSENLTTKSDFKQIEEQAHYFAGAFLLPATSFSDSIWGKSLDAFRSLKPVWNTSIAMQIMRAKQLKLLSEHEEKRLWINLSRRKWRKSEPLDDVTECEKPQLLQKCIKLLVDEGIKSPRQIVDEIALGEEFLTEVFSLDKNFFKNDESTPTFKKNDVVVPFERRVNTNQ